MARKNVKTRNKTKIFEEPVATYYIYYDNETGQPVCASNEKQTMFDNELEVTYDEYDMFVSGRERFTDYYVGVVKEDDKNVVKLISKTIENMVFRYHSFECIDKTPTTETELRVTWDIDTRQWIFSVSDACKNRLCNKKTPEVQVFFVMLQNDYDFLIRTITISTRELLETDIYVEFCSKFEMDIKNISISTKLFFESYGLIHE